MLPELNLSRKFRSGYFLLFLFSSAFLFGGCGVWRDFTTYFNIYYNAKDLFNEAERQIAEQRKNPYESYDVPPPANAGANLTKVVEKCSKILQFNKESSFVDKSLLMIGKSFYYQQNYIKALRKFEELIATQKGSKLAPEAKMWIGKTQMAMKNSSAGIKTLSEVRDVAKANGDDDIVVQTLIEEARFELDQKEYEKAIALLNNILSVSDDSSIRAITAYQAGLLYYDRTQYENAAAAFNKVFSYGPSFELELDASIQYARALRSLKKYDAALETLTDLRSEQKYSDSYDRIELEKGITYMQIGDKEKALELLTDVDTAYKATISAGNAKFEIGKLYEKYFLNYDSAYKFYQASLSSSVSAEYLPLIRNRSQIFTRYFQINTSLLNSLSQMRYADSPDVFIADSIAYYGDSTILAVKKNEKEFSENEKNFNRKGDEQNSERGRERQREREGEERGRERERDREPSGGVRDNLTPNTIPAVKKATAPLRPTLTKDSLYYLASKSSLDLGNLFYLELEIPDSALLHYTRAVERFPSKYTQPQALFALGSFYLGNNNKNIADSLFNYIYDNFKKDKVVNSAADKLNKPRIDFSSDPAKDKFVQIEKLFNDTTKYSFVLSSLYTIADSFPSSGYAPKSLHAAGMLLEDKLRLYDSAAAVYDSLAKKFPYSENTQKIASKLSSYKEEKARLARIISDSLDAIKSKRMQDSIALVKRADSLSGKHTDSLGVKSIDSTVNKAPGLSSDSTKTKLPPMLKPDANNTPDPKKENNGKEEQPKDPIEKSPLSSNFRQDFFLESWADIHPVTNPRIYAGV